MFLAALLSLTLSPKCPLFIYFAFDYMLLLYLYILLVYIFSVRYSKARYI